MQLAKYDRPLINNRIKDPFESVFKDLWEDLEVPNFGVQENEDSLKIETDVPGVSKEDIKVKINNNMLYVTAEKGKRKYNKAWTLASYLDVHKIEATLKDGVLSIEVPKKEEAKPKEIEIKVK